MGGSRLMWSLHRAISDLQRRPSLSQGGGHSCKLELRNFFLSLKFRCNKYSEKGMLRRTWKMLQEITNNYERRTRIIMVVVF